MSKSLFYEDIVYRTFRFPIDRADLIDGLPQSVDINLGLPDKFEDDILTHYKFDPYDENSKLIAVENHNARVAQWNAKHPKLKLDVLSVMDELLHPVIILDKVIYCKEISDEIRKSGIVETATKINKAILVYFKEKLFLAEELDISDESIIHIKSDINSLNEWFVNENINPNEITSLFDDNKLSNTTKDQNESNYEAIVRTHKIKKLRESNKLLALQNKNLKKYKTGYLTDSDIQDIVDSTRKKNGKINYTAAGKIIGVSKDTFRNLIIRRKLHWLIEKSTQNN